MSDQRSDPNAASRAAATPFADNAAWQPYAAAIAQIEPISRSVLCTQMAMASFIGTRGRARLDYATEVTRCRSPEDFVRATSDFWVRAGREYTDYAANMASLWQRALGLVPPAEHAVTGSETKRDLMRMPDAAVTNGPKHAAKSGARHAA